MAGRGRAWQQVRQARHQWRPPWWCQQGRSVLGRSAGGALGRGVAALLCEQARAWDRTCSMSFEARQTVVGGIKSGQASGATGWDRGAWGRCQQQHHDKHATGASVAGAVWWHAAQAWQAQRHTASETPVGMGASGAAEACLRDQKSYAGAVQCHLRGEAGGSPAEDDAQPLHGDW